MLEKPYEGADSFSKSLTQKVGSQRLINESKHIETGQ